MQNSQTGRLLAVVIRSGRFGYAAFETPARLLDFGVSRFGSRVEARNRIRSLLKTFQPSSITIDSGGRNPLHKRRAPIARMIRTESQTKSVQVTVISQRELRTFFRRHGTTNKYDFSVVAAGWYPELAWKLPPKRRFYHPEPWVMTGVDAVILGAAYLDLNQPFARKTQLAG
jgi:hypothetical protein